MLLCHVRALLLSEALEEICQAKRQRYETWRRKELRVPFMKAVKRRIRRFVFWTAVPASLVVYASCHGWSKTRMLNRVQDAKNMVLDKTKLRLRFERCAGTHASAATSPMPAAAQAGSVQGAADALHRALPALSAADAAAHQALNELKQPAAQQQKQQQKQKPWFGWSK